MKIAYFAPIFFDYLKQRPQHIAELLANDNEVFYIEPTISVLRYLFKNDKNFKSKKIDVNANLHIVRASGILTIFRSLEVFDIVNIITISEYIQLRELVNSCDLIWCGDPLWYKLLSRFRNKKIVFDKMDDNEKLTDNKFLKLLIRRNEKKIILKSDVVIVSCQKFYNELFGTRDNVFLVRNGVPNNFRNMSDNYIKSEKNKGKIFGYIGMVSKWFDFHVIDVILQEDLNNKVVIVGDNLMPPITHSNVRYIPRVSKEEVASYISNFDVCLYNFKKDSLLDTINPVKIYEYLALNKPVIAVRSIETEALSEYLLLYENDDELRSCLSGKITTPFKSDEEIITFIKEHSWEKIVKDIIKILSKI